MSSEIVNVLTPALPHIKQTAAEFAPRAQEILGHFAQSGKQILESAGDASRFSQLTDAYTNSLSKMSPEELKNVVAGTQAGAVGLSAAGLWALINVGIRDIARVFRIGPEAAKTGELRALRRILNTGKAGNIAADAAANGKKIIIN